MKKLGTWTFQNTDDVTISHNGNSENIYFSVFSFGVPITDYISDFKVIDKNTLRIILSQSFEEVHVLIEQGFVISAQLPTAKMRRGLQSGDYNIYRSFFQKSLEEHGQYSSSVIANNFLNKIFESPEELPSQPEENISEPRFAMISDSNIDGAKLAYWDYYQRRGWFVTEYPWVSPRFEPQSVKQNSPGGNSNWQYSMGSIFHAVENCSVLAIEYFMGVNAENTSHSWELRRSLLNQQERPPNSTYTEILASGVFSCENVQEWTPFEDTNIDIDKDDWLMLLLWVGQGGVSYRISTARNAGELDETLLVVDSGCYITSRGTNPGTVIVPTNNTTSDYGCLNLKVISR